MAASRPVSKSDEQLRAIFTFHEGTKSQTHDLLGCKCLDGVEYDNDDDALDDAEDLLTASFSTASKLKPTNQAKVC